MARPREDHAADERRTSLDSARLLGRYRKLILLGRLRVPLEAGRRIVGPDCAYHLYGRSAEASRRRRARRRG